jgi:muramoyltetrapeptide carboxypeptidase LdcA involved in peptidoglycan recycling
VLARPGIHYAIPSREGVSTEFRTPPALSSGDRVAVIAPSSGAAKRAPQVLERGLDRLEQVFDLEPVVYPTARQGEAFLGAHPRARAADLHAAARDPEIRAAFATIGGDDQIRVLAHLDPEVLRENPIRLFGMSDSTNLACYRWNLGLVSHYGGQLMNQVAVPGPIPGHTERYLRRALFEDSLGELEAAAEWADLTADFGEWLNADPAYEPAPGWTWAGGESRVKGRLWGGCLEVLAWQLMTDRYLPAPADLAGAVLLLETAEDLPEAKRVRWVLTCMGERGLLERFDAVLVGRPATQNWRTSRTPAERAAYRERQREAIRVQLDRYNPAAPVVFDIDVGHTNPTTPLPIGSRVVVDPGERAIRFP